MKGVVYYQYGPPKVLSIASVPKPNPKSDELLIKVKATSVNRTDCANLRAKPDIMRLTMGLFRPKNNILGTEFSGVVVQKGSKVKGFDLNDRVFGFDDAGLSSYAEYLCIAESKAVGVMPDTTDFLEMGCCLEGAHYAYNFINKVALKSGEKVLVNGGTGGIGTAMIQLLKHYGAHITAVGNTKNLSLLRQLGASEVYDYKVEDFTKAKKKYHYIFDCVGKSSFDACKPLLKEGGVYISSELGKNSINLGLALVSKIFGSLPNEKGKKVVFPYPPNKRRSLELIKNLITAKKFSPVIDRVYPIEEIRDAFEYVEKGLKTGNVAILLKEK
ncbi:NAD(P)-dependent alcohol dehydrogenase [Eudoraea chungangensis]|uniref:NAD(P)-dependent alcohol dehydrogenase n=1 Tax=Eudoraea chungangensis TaxID=1481905 RepID=UPI0023ECF58B|nr:NAD(P)-dependent alcohol dehydrogenase [Eudoraea chungangensis]